MFSDLFSFFFTNLSNDNYTIKIIEAKIYQ